MSELTTNDRRFAEECLQRSEALTAYPNRFGEVGGVEFIWRIGFSTSRREPTVSITFPHVVVNRVQYDTHMTLERHLRDGLVAWVPWSMASRGPRRSIGPGQWDAYKVTDAAHRKLHELVLAAVEVAQAHPTFARWWEDAEVVAEEAGVVDTFRNVVHSEHYVARAIENLRE